MYDLGRRKIPPQRAAFDVSGSSAAGVKLCSHIVSLSMLMYRFLRYYVAFSASVDSVAFGLGNICARYIRLKIGTQSEATDSSCCSQELQRPAEISLVNARA
ncbi:hypothetical protein KC349_g220 [Hortaea werneckii]|nr:hypothetical protein KC349_g220 [Hortaea werneckii]